MIASACQIVLELILGELEPDQCLEARAQHRFADVGLRQRIDRGIDVARLALAVVDFHVVDAGCGRGVLGHEGSASTTWKRSEEHTSELQSLMRISYAVFCLKKKN